MSSMREGLKLLEIPDFARLFSAYVITFSGNAMAPIAIAFGVLGLTGSTEDASLVIAAPTAASIVVLLIGGALADRASRQRQMVFAESLAAISQATIAVLFLSGQATVALLTLLMLANGVAAALNSPAATGFIPQVVERHQLQAANALLGAARSGATTLGAAIAGVLVAAFGAGVTIAVDAATFVVSALLIAGIKARAQAPAGEASIFTDLRLGWREFTSHQWLWTIVLQFSLLVAAGDAVFGLLGPAVARSELNGALGWGLISASFGVGTIVGGLTAMRLNVQRPMLVATFCVFFWAGVPLALSIPAGVPVIAFAAFVSGITGQVFSVLWYTTLQTQIPSHLLSRVSAYDHLGSIALAPLGIVVGGILFEAIGSTRTLLLAAAVYIVPTLFVLLVPDVRRLRSSDAPPAIKPAP